MARNLLFCRGKEIPELFDLEDFMPGTENEKFIIGEFHHSLKASRELEYALNTAMFHVDAKKAPKTGKTL